MKKAEFVKSVSEKVEGLTQKEAEAAYNAVFETLKECMLAGEKHTVQGFTTFDTKPTKERECLVNPRQPELGKKIVPASTKPTCKWSKTFKDDVKEM